MSERQHPELPAPGRCSVCGRELAAGEVLFCSDPDGLCRAAWQETHRVRFTEEAAGAAPEQPHSASVSPEPAPYWTGDEEVGEIVLWGEPWSLRLALHVADEPYSGSRQEIVPLHTPHGTRTYVHARPYILAPDMTLGIRLYDRPEPGGLIGEVTERRWEGMRHEYLGKAQAWVYPADRLIVLWECFYEERYRLAESPADPPLRLLWQACERFLLDRFPDTEQIVTPATDPLYETPDYQQFLEGLGYRRLNPRAYGKQR